MNPAEYEKYVRGHAVWFRGHNPEKLDLIFRAEQRLGVTFPESLKWLLTQYGYWHATGVAGLPCIVGATLANRPEFPKNWLLLGQPDSMISKSSSGNNNSKEPGSQMETIILVLSNQHRWNGKAVFHCDSNGEIIDRYPGFTEYTIARQRYLEKHSAKEHQSCLPSFHLSRGEPLVWENDTFNVEEFQRRLVETVLYQEIHLDTSKHVQPVGSAVQTETDIVSSKSTVCTVAPAAELVSVIIENRREYLHQNQHRIPSSYQDSSSSPRQNLQFESIEIKGHLLIAEFHSEAASRSLLISELKQLGISENQIVSLITEAKPSKSRDWVVCWISEIQISKLTARLESHPREPCYRFVAPVDANNIISQLQKVA